MSRMSFTTDIKVVAKGGDPSQDLSKWKVEDKGIGKIFLEEDV